MSEITIIAKRKNEPHLVTWDNETYQVKIDGIFVGYSISHPFRPDPNPHAFFDLSEWTEVS